MGARWRQVGVAAAYAATRSFGPPAPHARLKDTPAIGPVAKLRLKSEIEHLVSDLAAFHAGHATETLEGSALTSLVGAIGLPRW